MAFHRYPITFAKLLIIAVLAYISLSGTSCNNIKGDKNMPFRDLDGNESLSIEIVNVKEYEAIGDGIKDDSSAITKAIAAASNSTLLLPAGTYRIGSNVIVPSDVTVWFTNGAKLSIDSGKTFTINGKLDAGLSQIFSGSGAVSIAKGSVEYILPQWWGAKGDGVTDDTAAINTAIDVASQKLAYATAPKVQEVFLPNGFYKITSPLLISYGTSLHGNGMNSTIIDVYGDVNGIEATYHSAETPDSSVLSNFRMRNRGTVGVGYGILMSAQRSARVEKVWIGGWYDKNYYFERGIYIHDAASYYTTIRDCKLFRNTYNIYCGYGANNVRIVGNDIWYGDYGVYLSNAHGVRIIDNTLEGFAQRGVYTDSNGTVIFANWIESNGVYSVELAPTSARTYIAQNGGVTGFGGSSDVLNNSTGTYNRIYDNYIPIGWHSSQTGDDTWALAGTLSCTMENYHVKDTILEALTGSLYLKALTAGKKVEINSPNISMYASHISVNGSTQSNGEVLSLASSATNLPALCVSGGSTVNTHAFSGEIDLGSTASGNGRIAWAATSGKLYIDNTWDNVDSAIYLRTRASGTPINNLVLKGASAGFGGAATLTDFALNVVSNATNHSGLVVYGGGTIDNHMYSGEMQLGSESNHMLFAYSGQTGKCYIDNSYNNDTGNFYFRTKTSGTPVNALTILGSGKVGFNTTAPAAQVAINGGLHVGGTTDPGDKNLTVDGKASAKTINGAVSALTNSSTISCTMDNGNVFTLSTTTAVGNVQINATGGTAGQRATFIITDDATGGHVVTFGTNFKPSGTLTGIANKSATVDFVYNGTNWYEISRLTGL
jgi:hypothetical protein